MLSGAVLAEALPQQQSARCWAERMVWTLDLPENSRILPDASVHGSCVAYRDRATGAANVCTRIGTERAFDAEMLGLQSARGGARGNQHLFITPAPPDRKSWTALEAIEGPARRIPEILTTDMCAPMQG